MKIKDFITFLLLFYFTQSFTQNNTTNFVADPSNIRNPERGLMSFITLKSSNYIPISEAFLQSEFNENISITYLGIYLDSFMSSPISSSFLEQLNNDFNTLRQNGFKVILRFAYNDTYQGPPYLDSPPKTLILQHIQQLTSLLQQNSDIISVLQAGFIGTWGEEAYSDYFGTDWPVPLTADNINDRKDLYNALLNALTENRKISSRTPIIKSKLYNFNPLTDSLTLNEAHTTSAKSRIAYHNDCFLNNYTDAGTYGYEANDTLIFKPYVAAESKYLPIGGETCGYNPEFGSCINTIKEMKRFHWSYLNKYYHPDNYTQWNSEGCLDEIKNKLGYRFELQSATFPSIIHTDTPLSYNIELINNGFATPFNQRKVELVLKNNINASIYTIDLTETDPRYWFSGETYMISESMNVPNSIPTGNYHLYLNLPDNESSISSNPSYSIRFANLNTWDSNTGFNDLLLNIDVVNTLDIEEFTDDNFFQIIPNPVLDYFTIIFDESNSKTENKIQIFNTLGKLLKEFNVKNHSKVPVSDLSNGIYIVKVNDYKQYKKFIKL